MFVKVFKYLALTVIAVAIALLMIDRWVSYQASDQVYMSQAEVENVDVAVVLGTSKYLGKVLNEYYTQRIDAAISLYQEGKVANFLLSGDNAHRSYNEPWTMKRDLLKAGIPDEKIFLDYAGFRTLDSVVRAKEIFDTDDFLIISQKFHCERALFIANFHDINAKCIAVPGPTSHSGIKVRVREVFARAKAVLDLYITNARPKFLGPKEPIITTEPTPEQIAEEEAFNQAQLTDLVTDAPQPAMSAATPVAD
nr:ElyC/SanA/YdcF family protein [Vibrio hepatarius]